MGVKHNTHIFCMWLRIYSLLTFLVSNVDSSLRLQQQRDELQVPIEGCVMQWRKPTLHTHTHTHTNTHIYHYYTLVITLIFCLICFYVF